MQQNEAFLAYEKWRKKIGIETFRQDDSLPLTVHVTYYHIVYIPQMLTNIKYFLCTVQSAGKLIETGLNTLQKTLLLKREVEVERVTDELQSKRNEFQKRMELCEKKRLEIQLKQQQVCDSARI